MAGDKLMVCAYVKVLSPMRPRPGRCSCRVLSRSELYDCEWIMFGYIGTGSSWHPELSG